MLPKVLPSISIRVTLQHSSNMQVYSRKAYVQKSALYSKIQQNGKKARFKFKRR